MSIGLPVFNGGRYLEEALDSILGQTVRDFELIVSDNASTDETLSILSEVARTDPRIVLHRNEKNIGGNRNANLTLDMARGKYFRWASHDDVLLPTLLERLVGAMEASEDIILCYSGSLVVDERINEVRQSTIGRGMALDPAIRFRELSSRIHACEPIYGLVRTDMLRSIRPLGNYVDADRIALCELALRGRFLELPEPLFKKRYHDKNIYVNWNARMAWYNPDERDRINLPFWTVLRQLATAPLNAPISWWTRVRCVPAIVSWIRSSWRRLIKDVLVAIAQAVRPPVARTWPSSHYNWE